jgi:hypothetical protein
MSDLAKGIVFSHKKPIYRMTACTKCPSWDDELLKDENYTCCELCEASICKVCVVYCSDSGQESCRGCLTECKVCEEMICYSETCGECGNRCCGGCLDECRECKKDTCKDCMVDFDDICHACILPKNTSKQ